MLIKKQIIMLIKKQIIMLIKKAYSRLVRVFLLRVSSTASFETLYKQSNVRFVYKTHFGIDTFVHHEMLRDIIQTDTSCDAEPWMRALDPLLVRMEICLDVGANIGVVGCWLAKRAEYVFCFEPEIQNQEFLKKNVKLNKIKNLKLVPVAVAEKSGVAEFAVRGSFGHHGLHGRHVTKTITSIKMPTINLDKFCTEKKLKKISLLKIDVEGSEITVLRGFKKYLRECRVNLIVFEYAPVLHQGVKEQMAVFDFLTEMNYSVYDLKGKVVSRAEMLKQQQGDFYAKPVNSVYSVY